RTVVDSRGNIYIADRDNDRIRKVDAETSIITTVAGNGKRGFSGDGGLATAASLNQPLGIAVDTHGNLFIADTHNNRVRKVAPSGVITTVVGTGDDAPLGDNGSASSASLSLPWGLAVDNRDNLFIADWGHNRIRKVDPAAIITTVAGSGIGGSSGD